MNKLWATHEQLMNKSQTKFEQVVHEQFISEAQTSREQVINNSWTTQEQVETKCEQVVNS